MMKKFLLIASICIFVFSTTISNAQVLKPIKKENMIKAKSEILNIQNLETFSYKGTSFKLDKGTQYLINRITTKSVKSNSNKETVAVMFKLLDQLIADPNFKNRYPAQKNRMINSVGLDRLKIALMSTFEQSVIQKFKKSGQNEDIMGNEKVQYVIFYMILFRTDHFIKSINEEQNSEYYLDLYSTYNNYY